MFCCSQRRQIKFASKLNSSSAVESHPRVKRADKPKMSGSTLIATEKKTFRSPHIVSVAPRRHVQGGEEKSEHSSKNNTRGRSRARREKNFFLLTKFLCPNRKKLAFAFFSSSALGYHSEMENRFIWLIIFCVILNKLSSLPCLCVLVELRSWQSVWVRVLPRLDSPHPSSKQQQESRIRLKYPNWVFVHGWMTSLLNFQLFDLSDRTFPPSHPLSMGLEKR